MQNQSTRDQLLAALRGQPVLPQTVQRRFRLTRAGHRWKAPCPFHTERTPSFYVGRWWYVCYGCGAEGHVIDFVQRYDEISEQEAIDHIAMQFGVSITGTSTPVAGPLPQPSDPDDLPF